MSEEQQVQFDAPAEGAGAEVGGRTRGSKAVIAVVIVLVIIAAVAVYARGGFGGADTDQAGEAEAVERFGDGAALEEGAIENEAQSGTVIDEGTGFAVDASEGQTKTFDVTGKNFEFSLKEIRVKIGDTVRVNFTSAGGTHNWMIDEFSATTETVNQGGASAVIFTANKAGEFEYYCGIGSHRSLGMVGTLIVEE